MAGYTDLPFRLLVRRLGCELAWTEMISAEGLARRMPSTRELLKTHPEDRPLVVQLFGANPESLARAAVQAEEAGADALDINMGCPVKKVVQTGAGAALLKDLKRAEAVIRAVRKAVSLPLTIKIRLGWKEGEAVYRTLALMAEGQGVEALILHPRYALQGFRGSADWSAVAELKGSLKIPVIGSGDIVTPEQALKRKEETGCDGVMIGRQALRTPWIFTQIREMEERGTYSIPHIQGRREWLFSHWQWVEGHYTGQAQVQALRRFLFILTRGLPGSGAFRQRTAMAKTPDTLKELFHEYFDSLGRME